jgi:hypothetical protein
MNPRFSKSRFSGMKEELDFSSINYLKQGNDMFRKRSKMFSFDGSYVSSIKSKESSMKTTSKKSSENSLMR